MDESKLGTAAAPWPVVVVGAGAAGLWAAWRSASLGARTLVVEKTPRTGTKVLASGGTHCNLTTTLEPEGALALFGDRGARFLARALWNLPPAAVRERFDEWGVPTVEAPLEKIFPQSGNARDVRDALERAVRSAGATIRTTAPVAALEPAPFGWHLVLEGGERIAAARVILCPGGRSYPRTGTTGDGYGWCTSLDLPLVEQVPALVPLTSPDAWARELTGIAVQEAEVRLVAPNGRTLGRRRRPVLFTHNGLSGPGPMDLSEPVARANGGLRIAIDLFPDTEREELRDLLVSGASTRGAPKVARMLPAPLPARLRAAVFAAAGLEGDDPRCSELDRATRHQLVESLKALHVRVDGTLGYDKAEVTAGGLDLRVVDPGTMAVRGRQGLFACGELLDVQGPIGGLNFQAAFATAELAGLAAAGD
ncbi:putative FAD-binding dehydrogenase [Planctomycetes bacterium Pla163]|uniref:Putative FAD-binding dehydrogenase n=1 Tax=Rohdeia mirabilis TaxID=2528008 RepID=A0A518D0L6_9BACT|nr:putative FAD-binding dehydrogenase [Planctomycetes bacterium Pla163]